MQLDFYPAWILCLEKPLKVIDSSSCLFSVVTQIRRVHKSKSSSTERREASMKAQIWKLKGFTSEKSESINPIKQNAKETT